MVNSGRRGESGLDRLSQRTRRVIAVATLIGLPAMYAWSSFWLTTPISTVVWGPVSFLLIGATVVGAFVLYRFVRDRAEMRGQGLDERQRHLRDQAYVLSYVVLSTVVIAVVAAIAVRVMGFGHDITLDGTMASAIAITIGTLIPLLPIAALAWLEPDAPEEA